MTIDEQMKEAHTIEINVNESKTWYNFSRRF
jgi:hypothetical protein